MKRLNLWICFFFVNTLVYAQNTHNLTINTNGGITSVVVDHHKHIDYGLSYPITYQFSIPSLDAACKTLVKWQVHQEWVQLEQKTKNDFFNGIEVVRYDFDEKIAYVSVSFRPISDTIYIKFDDGTGTLIDPFVKGVSKYYDNRKAAVICTADDWGAWSNQKFLRTVRIFRSFNLWLSVAIVTKACEPSTWNDIQIQLDSGFVEAVSHSRTHPHLPYHTIFSEVAGSKKDIIENLDLPGLWRNNKQEYVYAWVAPYGEYHEDIAAIVGHQKYLVSRMYYDNYHSIADWDDELDMFSTIGVSREAGPLWEGITDTAVLNQTFDQVAAAGDVYHVMCHPNVIEWEKEYPWVHLSHISNRKDIWYVSLGHLYLYRYLQYPLQMSTQVFEPDKITFVMLQNYPNPFHDHSRIPFSIEKPGQVFIGLYNTLGEHVATAINEYLPPGNYHAEVNRASLSPGIYFYSMLFRGNKTSKKLIVK